MTLNPLDDAPDVDGGALQPSLTLADIDALHAKIDAYVDQLVREREHG